MCVVFHPARLKVISKLKTICQSFQMPLGKTSGCRNSLWDVKCRQNLFLHFSIGTAENHNGKSKIAISTSVTHFVKEMMQTSLCICRVGWVPAECKLRGSFSLHSSAPMQSTPSGWCRVCHLVWGSGRMWASSSSCCQLHWVSLAPSFMLCLAALCVRAGAAFSCQWLVPEVPSPFSTCSYLALPSCHQDMVSSSRSQIHIA